MVPSFARRVALAAPLFAVGLLTAPLLLAGLVALAFAPRDTLGLVAGLSLGGVAMVWTGWRARHDAWVRAETTRALAAALAREQDRARRDPLTGLLNRRGFEEALQAAALRAREGGTLSVALLDLDGFKHVNDRHGHLAGDEILREVARILQGSVRDGDACARIGGDEFAVVFAGPLPLAGGAALTRARRRIAALSNRFRDVAVDVSVGVAWFDHVPDDLTEIVRLADERLYQDKFRRVTPEPALAV